MPSMDDKVPLYIEEIVDENEEANGKKDFGNRKYIHVGESKPSATKLTKSNTEKSNTTKTGAAKSSVSNPGANSISKQEEEVETQEEVRRRSETDVQKKRESRISSTFTRWLTAHRAMPSSKSLNKQWIHPPETLLNSQVIYNVKFLGEVEVAEAKGTTVVKEAVRKMKFTSQIKKSEGEKPTKVDIVISVENVRIQDPKTKAIKHQYPLHRISYCADEKADSRVFTFIAKHAETNKHFCYGFDSDKCSQDITLTVGQAFDLAYRRYLESGKDIDLKNQVQLLQKQVKNLQKENSTLKLRICDLERLKSKDEINTYKQQHNILDLSDPDPTPNGDIMNSDNTAVNALNSDILLSRSIVGRKLEHLVYDSEATAPSEPVYSTVNKDNATLPTLTPPPTNTKPRSPSQPQQHRPVSNGFHPATSPNSENPFGAPRHVDEFGMEAFTPSVATENEYKEMQSGFQEGLSFGTDDFSLADLDPLHIPS